MKKILNIVSGNPSGALNVSMDISKYLKKQGYIVIDIFRKYNRTNLYNVIVIKDKFTLDFIISLRKFIVENKPDLILVHGYSTHIWVKLAVKYSGLKVKVIHIEHNMEKYTGLRRYLTKKLDNITCKYICVSKGVATHLIKQGIDKNKVKVIYNGIDLRKFDLPKQKHDIFTVSMVARFSKQKDQMTLVKAIEYLIKEKNEQIRLILMGNGKTRAYIQRYIDKNKLNEDITILEGNFLDLITKVDLFVLSTHYEGLPLVLCEAMASSTPVIATNIPGVDEIITNEKTGLLVQEKNIKNLSEAIMYIKNNTSIRETFIEQGYKVVCSRFDINTMYCQYEKIIKDELSNNILR